jgi:hypothetical protein
MRLPLWCTWLAVGFVVAAAAAAQVAVGTFGAGCGGAGQPVTLSIAPAMRPGQVSVLQIDHLVPNQLAMLMFGTSRSDWWGTALPLPLGSIGMPGCELLVAPETSLLFGTGSGTAASSFTVPSSPALAAQRLFLQVMFEQPGFNGAQLGVSRALEARIAPWAAPTAAVTSITQHGITFQFAAPVQAGQFVNGDWFVVGPVSLVDMTPPCVTSNGRVMHGAMIDPDPSTLLHGYDKALYGPGNEARYQDALNVARNLSPQSPRLLTPGHSLIKVISSTDPTLIPQLHTCAVLTVLAEAPPQGAFRPPYAGTDHSVRYDEQMLDLSRLQSLPPAAGMPGLLQQLPKFERPWLDHGPGWPTRYMHPIANMPDYGRDFASLFNEAALQCNTNAPLADRRQLAIRLVQIGIDFFGNVRGGAYWEGVGGHGSGRKFPILFAGALLGDPAMLAVGQDYPSVRNLDGTYTVHFGEDAQTFYVQQTSSTQINWGYGGYTAAELGLPEWGFSHTHSPNGDDVNWTGNNYRQCCTVNGWIGAVLCARIMGLRDEWNHPALFDYTDRYTQIHTSGWMRSWSPWVGGMWDLHRASF